MTIVAATLAHYHAKKAVHAQLRREKIKIAEVDASAIRRAADAYLAEYRAELLVQAERTIAARPVLQRMVERERRAKLTSDAQRNAHWPHK